MVIITPPPNFPEDALQEIFCARPLSTAIYKTHGRSAFNTSATLGKQQCRRHRLVCAPSSRSSPSTPLSNSVRYPRTKHNYITLEHTKARCPSPTMQREDCWILCCPLQTMEEDSNLESIAKSVDSLHTIWTCNSVRRGKSKYEKTPQPRPQHEIVRLQSLFAGVTRGARGLVHLRRRDFHDGGKRVGKASFRPAGAALSL